MLKIDDMLSFVKLLDDMLSYVKLPFARNGAFLFLRLCLVTAILLATLNDARAAALALGLASEIHTLDPHRATTPAEVTAATHVFETLVTLGARSKILPALATEWVRVDERTWRLKLRP